MRQGGIAITPALWVATECSSTGPGYTGVFTEPDKGLITELGEECIMGIVNTLYVHIIINKLDYFRLPVLLLLLPPYVAYYQQQYHNENNNCTNDSKCCSCGYCT